MIVTRSRGRPKLTTMPMIATTASVVSMEFSEGQGGQHYRASGRGGQCRRGWNTPLTHKAYPADSPEKTGDRPRFPAGQKNVVCPRFSLALGELLGDALGDRRLVWPGKLAHPRERRGPSQDARQGHRAGTRPQH